MRVLIIFAYYTMNMYFALSQMLPVSTTLTKRLVKKMTISAEAMFDSYIHTYMLMRVDVGPYKQGVEFG